MPFGVVSGIGRGMGVLDGVVIVEGEGAVLVVNLGRHIVTNGDFVEYVRERRAFLKLLWGGLFIVVIGRMSSRKAMRAVAYYHDVQTVNTDWKMAAGRRSDHHIAACLPPPLPLSTSLAARGLMMSDDIDRQPRHQPLIGQSCTTDTALSCNRML